MGEGHAAEGRLREHSGVQAKVAGVKDGAEGALEEEHGAAWTVIRIDGRD